jgi:hypothetical protein
MQHSPYTTGCFDRHPHLPIAESGFFLRPPIATSPVRARLFLRPYPSCSSEQGAPPLSGAVRAGTVHGALAHRCVTHMVEEKEDDACFLSG